MGMLQRVDPGQESLDLEEVIFTERLGHTRGRLINIHFRYADNGQYCMMQEDAMRTVLSQASSDGESSYQGRPGKVEEVTYFFSGDRERWPWSIPFNVYDGAERPDELERLELFVFRAKST